MAEPNANEPGRAPGGLRAVRVILYIQAGATLLLLVMLMFTIKEANDHGQEVAGYAYPLMVVSVICAVTAFVCAVNLSGQVPKWVLPTVMTVEVITMIFGLINLISGAPAGIGQIAIPIAVIALLRRSDVRNWIDGGAKRDVTGAP